MSKILKREDIDNKYKWDLAPLCADDTQFEKEIAEVLKLIPKIEAFKGTLGDRVSLLKCFKTEGEIMLKFEKLYCYAQQKSDENTADNTGLVNSDKASNVYSKYCVASSYIMPEISKLEDKYLEDLILDSEFADYDVSLKSYIRHKKHTLTEKEEALLANGSEVFGGFSDIFNMLNNADMKFGEMADENGEMVELSHSKYGYFMTSDNREVRKNAYEKMYDEYKKLLRTIAQTYTGNVKKDVFVAKVRGFDSALERSMFNEEVSPVVYENLLANVEKALPVLHDYVAFRKKVMNLDEIHFYDLYVAMVENSEMKLPYEKAYELMKKALKPLGEDYVNTLTEAYEDRWIDVYNNVGKRSGAYSNSAFGVHPYVLLNYEENLDNMFTVAHEMGHAMHSYYSNNTQPYEKAGYTIFVAEVASTVNEVLLLRYLIDNTTDVNEKKFYLNHFLDMFRTTLFRQTMFAEFEYITHDLCEQDIPLTSELYSDAYEGLNMKYYGEEIVHDEYIKHEWARIPHFYRSFYVYKYATGITSAITIAYNILEQGEPYVKKYREFLSSGCTLAPTELLKIADVDLTTNAPFENAMNVFEKALNDLKNLF